VSENYGHCHVSLCISQLRYCVIYSWTSLEYVIFIKNFPYGGSMIRLLYHSYLTTLKALTAYLSQFCCYYKVAFAEDRFVVDANNYVSTWNDL